MQLMIQDAQEKAILGQAPMAASSGNDATLLSEGMSTMIDGGESTLVQHKDNYVTAQSLRSQMESLRIGGEIPKSAYSSSKNGNSPRVQPPGHTASASDPSKNQPFAQDGTGPNFHPLSQHFVLDWALDLLAKLKSKQGMAIRRETRATKLVATVMVVFLVCWLPFFTLNMIKIYKLIFNVWSADLEIWFHWFTALGYLNSSLNFFIYSTINPKFRHSFRRLLGFRRSSRRQREKSWMLPPRDSSRPMNNRKISMQKPEIVIDEISPNRISISAGGNTTFRRSSDDCIRRSSSEIIGGITLPSQSSNDKRRGSGMSNSSASLHIHETRMTFEAMVNDQADCEIFV
nr:hypothetical protein C24A8.4 - Caenorhabditis elegans [Caenorhabditis elegans]